mgnify:CR=1 FL=1
MPKDDKKNKDEEREPETDVETNETPGETDETPGETDEEREPEDDELPPDELPPDELPPDELPPEPDEKKDEKKKRKLDPSVVDSLSVAEITSDVAEMLEECSDSYGTRAGKVLRKMNAETFLELPENRLRDLVRVGRVINEHVPPPPEPVHPCWHDVRAFMEAALEPYVD